MNFFWEFISILGGTVSLVGVAAFLAKLLAQHWLTKDLEDYKSSLGRDVETHKAQLARANSEALDRATSASALLQFPTSAARSAAKWAGRALMKDGSTR
jgi:hypothetical protein